MPGDRNMTTTTLAVYSSAMGYLLIIAFVLGAVLYFTRIGDKLGEKAQRLGQMLLFWSIGALLIATAPATVKLLHG